MFKEKPTHSNKKLIWFLKDLNVGNWTTGPNNDGSYVFHYQVKTSEVAQKIYFGIIFIIHLSPDFIYFSFS